MITEEYYIIRDTALKEINEGCEQMDNDSINSIDEFTKSMIYEINKWRIKNNLSKYHEEEKSALHKLQHYCKECYFKRLKYIKENQFSEKRHKVINYDY